MSVTTVNDDQVLLSSDDSEEEKFDNPDILFGHEARGKFWELYKNDRKFKDFNAKKDVSKDPRFAYFNECTQANILPRSSQIIKDNESTCLDFTNHFLKTSQQVKAVAESVKRLTRVTETVMFVNNSLNARDSIIVIDSFKLHYERLKKLIFSCNILGLDGSKHLSSLLPTMQNLVELRLSGCRIGDKGASSLLSTMDQVHNLHILDLSSN
jgi:hypothetical protein